MHTKCFIQTLNPLLKEFPHMKVLSINKFMAKPTSLVHKNYDVLCARLIHQHYYSSRDTKKIIYGYLYISKVHNNDVEQVNK
jgi:hypothetical protein